MTGGKGTSTRTSLEAYAAEAITPVMNRLIQSLLADRPDDVAAYVVERLAAEPAAPEQEADAAASLGLEGTAEEDAAAAKLQARQRGRQDRARVAELKAAQSSAAEGSGTGLISARGVRISGPLTSYSAMFFKAMPDLWHPEANPEGYFIFAAAENKLGYAHVKPLFDEAAQDFPHGELTTPIMQAPSHVAPLSSDSDPCRCCWQSLPPTARRTAYSG